MGSFSLEEKSCRLQSPGMDSPAGLVLGMGVPEGSFPTQPGPLTPLNGSAFHPADLMSLKRMMEKLGVPKTHLEMKKMISEVTGGVSDTISYRDFVNVMLGKRSAVLKL